MTWAPAGTGAVAGAASTNITPVSVAYPAGIVAGDILFLAVAAVSAGRTATIADAGFSIVENPAGLDTTLILYGKVATGSESGTTTVSLSASDFTYAQIARFTGGSLTVDGSNFKTGTGQTVCFWAAQTVTAANCLVVGLTSGFFASGVSGNINTPSPWTGQIGAAFSSPQAFLFGWDYVIQTTATNIPTGSWAPAVTGTGNYSSITVSLQTSSGPTLQTISVTPAAISLAAGQTQQYTATGHYSDGSTQNLTSTASWTSSNGSFATISSSGLATAVSTGTTTITATSGSISGNTTLTVGIWISIGASNGTLSGTSPDVETDIIQIQVQDALGVKASGFFTLQVQSTAGKTPNIAALPAASTSVPPWTSFLAATGGKSWGLNTAYTDNTGAVLRRLTNRTTLADGGTCNMEYAEGGAKISQQFNGNQYWVAFQDTGSSFYIGKYQLGTGFLSVTKPAAQIVSGNLGVCFSMTPGETNIVYLANSSASTVHRFDVNANAYAPNSVFSGTNASINCGVNNPGWLQTSWDGSRLVWQAPTSGPTAIFRLLTQTGSLATYTGSPTSTIMLKGGTATGGSTTTLSDSSRTWSLGPDGNGQWVHAAINMLTGSNAGQSSTVSKNTANTITFSPAFTHAVASGDTYSVINVNEPHMIRGSTDAVFLEDNSNAGSFPYAWFPNTDVCAQSVGYTYNQYGGHSDCGATNLYTLNPQGSFDVVQMYTPGTAPASDGGPWTGTQSNYWGTSAATNVDSGSADGHWNTTWSQLTASAGNEWAVHDSAGEPYNKNTAAGWSVQSGSIYKTTVNFGNYGASSRGVVGVLLWNGTTGVGSQITGNLTAAASLAAMTAGTFFWNGTTLYAWMPTGISPAGKVQISAASIATNAIVYVKQDGSQIRQLCWQYSQNNDMLNNYYANPFVSLSPDGLLAVFNSELGTYDGFADLVSAEVPTI